MKFANVFDLYMNYLLVLDFEEKIFSYMHSNALYLCLYVPFFIYP